RKGGVFILKYPGAPHTYVHSKIWIFDYHFAIIGSANCNRRSWTHDSECDIGTCDQGSGTDLRMAQRLRIRLWAEHLALHPLNVIDEAATANLWLPNSLPVRARVA